jgi:hypothetical protein
MSGKEEENEQVEMGVENGVVNAKAHFYTQRNNATTLVTLPCTQHMCL